MAGVIDPNYLLHHGRVSLEFGRFLRVSFISCPGLKSMENYNTLIQEGVLMARFFINEGLDHLLGKEVWPVKVSAEGNE